MKHPLSIIASRIARHPLAISSDGFRAFASNLRVAQEMDIGIEDFFTARAPLTIDRNGIAQVSVCGVLSGGEPPMFEKLLGNTCYETLRAELAQCAADPTVRGLLLNVNSPGGSTVGHDEARAAVMAVRAAGKPVMAYIHGEGCSAAYGIASAASLIYATPSSICGNIGSILSRLDFSKMAEEIGIKPEIYASDELKATFASQAAPTTEAQAAFVQDFVQQSAARFKAAVAATRPQIAAEDMAGQWFWGPEAARRGFVDYVCEPQKAYADLLALS